MVGCFLAGQCAMKKGIVGREPGIWVLVYLQPAGLSPRVAGPTVHLCILHLLEEPAGPPSKQEVQPVLAVRVAELCLDYLCTSPQLLAPLLWESQLGCVPSRTTKLCSANVAMGCPSPHSYLCYSLSTQRGKERWSVCKSLFINLLKNSASPVHCFC